MRFVLDVIYSQDMTPTVGVYFMYRSLQYVIFTPCNVVDLRRIILYCNIGWHVKDGVVHRSRQQWLVAKCLGLSVTVMVRARVRKWSYFFSSTC